MWQIGEAKLKILVLNGPSINLTGYREPEIYGHETYLDLERKLKAYGKEHNIKIKMVQTNSEGKLIDYLQEALYKGYDGVVLNAGAYTHYSYAIRDAITAISLDVVEVHLTDTMTREDFRKNNVIRDVCSACFEGKHFDSYIEGINYFIK